ncbi:MAG: hypothetical protein ACXABY_23515 [Candidatus Thorarchaeota archaeon]|jgi:hypothetical protein
MSVLELINNTQPTTEGLGNTVFGELKLFLMRVSNAQGSDVVIPGVRGGQFKDSDADGNLLFKGLRKGGNDLLLVQVLTRLNSQGEKYQQVKQYRSRQIARKGELEAHPYKQFGLPPIKNFFGTRLDDYLGQTSDQVLYSGKSAWVQLDDKPTGQTFNNNPITYWEIVKEFSDENAMRVTEEAFWLKVRGGDEQVQEPVSTVPPLDQLTKIPNSGGWTEQTWKEVGVPAVLKGKSEGKPAAETAVNLGVAPEFVEHVLETIPF